MDGLIVKTHNRFYHVSSGEDVWLCSPKGNFRKHEDVEYRLPVIGDRVTIKLDGAKKGVDGYITSIHERSNRLVRSDFDGRRKRVMAANLDQTLVVSAIKEPGVDYGLIDRYLLTCELGNIPYTLVINKHELDPDYTGALDIYREMDIPVLMASAETGEGMDDLRDLTATGVSLLTGASGVGKSSIINVLAPGSDLRTGSVDPRKGRGRHTTTNSLLVPIGDDGYLVDSPGLRDFYPPRVEPDQVRFGFREITQHQSGCRFPTCLHVNEPKCAVLEAVESGQISRLRYRSYLAILNEMKQFFENRY